jgi:hypothetical protein
MNTSVDSVRVAYPLFQTDGEGSSPISTLQAKQLVFEKCSKRFAVLLVEEWHSRLPSCQFGPWQFAFHAYYGDITYAVALWNNPCTRSLPHHWLELRRMACSDDSPKNTPSRFLGWMVRYFRTNYPEREKCISYQDTEVHKGTIYRACGWTAEHEGIERIRDRSKNRKNTNRMYRSNLNGLSIDAAKKIRWGVSL